MRKNGIFHPDFFYHPRAVVESAMIVDVDVYEPSGDQPEWVPGVGMTGDAYILRYTGKARVQPNKDWRARPREAAGEYTADHAVRVQIGIDSNTLTGPDASEDFAKDWLVVVRGSAVRGTETLVNDRYVVRNAMGSGNKWVHNLLCDANTRDEDTVP